MSDKTLVIYYSLGGNTKLLAETIAASLGADLARIKPVKEIPSSGFFKMLLGGWQVITKQKPKLLPLDKNPNDYDRILIGTPIWANNFTPAVNSFVTQNALKGKKIALFSTCMDNAQNAFKNLKAALPGNDFIGEFEITAKDMKDMKVAREKVAAWVGSLK